MRRSVRYHSGELVTASAILGRRHVGRGSERPQPIRRIRCARNAQRADRREPAHLRARDLRGPGRRSSPAADRASAWRPRSSWSGSAPRSRSAAARRPSSTRRRRELDRRRPCVRDAVRHPRARPGRGVRQGRCIAAWGRLDILVNNAGGQFPSPAQHISPNGFLAVVQEQPRRHVPHVPRGREPMDDPAARAAASST